MSLPFSVDDPGAPEPPPEPGRGSRFGLLRNVIGRLSPRTLSGRLMMGVVALVTVLVLLVGVATYTLLAPFLTARVDEQLTSVAQSSNIQRYVDYLLRPTTGLPGAQDLWLTVLAPDGSTVFNVPDDLLIHPLKLTPDDRKLLSAHPDTIRTVTTTDGVELRVLPRSVTYATNPFVPPRAGVAVVGLSMHDVNGTLHRLVRLEIVLGIAAIAFAAALTAWGVRAGLRPLYRVTRTAQEVTAELGPDGAGLDRRVPVEGAAVEVEQVASSVNTLLHAVETQFSARVASEERMRQFLADASHELRTPLTSIRGYAELSRLQSASGQAADDAMRRIETEGTRMSRLVEDLLVLARGDQDSALQLGEVPVDDLMSEAATAVHAAYPGRTIEVAAPTGLAVLGDWDQLLRVLINLTTNAAVHTADGAIRLSAVPSMLPGAASAVALRVSDAGPGLPPAEAAHVFERFWRADKARSRARGGSGLGMAIVAQLVAAHGGSVHFDSSVEHGTTVTVVLPVAGPRQGHRAEGGFPDEAAEYEPTVYGSTAYEPTGYEPTGYESTPYAQPPVPSRRSGEPSGPPLALPPDAPAPPPVPSSGSRQPDGR